MTTRPTKQEGCSQVCQICWLQLHCHMEHSPNQIQTVFPSVSQGCFWSLSYANVPNIVFYKVVLVCYNCKDYVTLKYSIIDLLENLEQFRIEWSFNIKASDGGEYFARSLRFSPELRVGLGLRFLLTLDDRVWKNSLSAHFLSK